MALSEEQKKKIEEEEAYRSEIKQNLKKKKGMGLLGWIVILFIGGILVSVMVSAINPSQQIERAKQSQSQNVNNQYVFDVPALIGKNIDEVRGVLGNPEEKELEPTKLQVEIGGYEWSNTFKNDKGELLVTYNSNTRKIVDFFISTDDPSGLSTDTQRLLQMGNLQENDPNYSVEFVKAIKDPNGFTGVKVIPNL